MAAMLHEGQQGVFRARAYRHMCAVRCPVVDIICARALCTCPPPLPRRPVAGGVTSGEAWAYAWSHGEVKICMQPSGAQLQLSACPEGGNLTWGSKKSVSCSWGLEPCLASSGDQSSIFRHLGINAGVALGLSSSGDVVPGARRTVHATQVVIPK